MATRENLAESLRNLVSSLLDGRYEAIASAPVREMVQVLNQRSVNNALRQLELEVASLQADGTPLQPDNETLLEAIDVIERAIRQAIIVVEDVTGQLIETGSRAAGIIQPARALPLILIGAIANPFSEGEYDLDPDPLYLDSIRNLPLLTRDSIIKQVLQGVALGWGARRTFNRVNHLVRNYPIASIQRSMRTEYLSSYRRGVGAWSEANEEYIDYRIRVAVLDDRTCLTCIALHGSRLPAKEVIVDDHYNGRCDSIPVMKGMGLEIETGEEWLRRQPASRQRAILGAANYAAWADNAVKLSDFVTYYEDDVYGRMPVQQSLVGILGDKAQQYYTRR